MVWMAVILRRGVSPRAWVYARVAQRLLALAAAIWHNRQIARRSSAL